MPVRANQQELTYNSFVWTQEVLLRTWRSFVYISEMKLVITNVRTMADHKWKEKETIYSGGAKLK